MKKRGFLVVAHGSKKAEANDRVFALVSELKEYFQTDLFEPAFMEMAKPSIPEGVRALAAKSIDEIVVFPFFLFRGMHYSSDVPKIIASTIAKLERPISTKMLDPIGMHPKIFSMVEEMLYDDVSEAFEFTSVNPGDIEDKSMEIIEASLGGADIAPEQRPIIKRAIHTTGDFDFLNSMVFHKDAVTEGLRALREGCTIFTDVTMVQSGINKRFDHEVRCVLNEEAVVKGAEKGGMTKAAFGISSLGKEMDGAIVAIGNAPTALIKLVDMVKAGEVKPALIVGIPVGFVNAKEAKHYLTTLPALGGTPYITNKGHKGGSTVAAAIVNALIKMEVVFYPLLRFSTI